MKKYLFLLLLWLPLSSAFSQDLVVYEAKGPVKQIIWKSEKSRPYPIIYFYGTQEFTRGGRLIGFEKMHGAQRDRKGRMKHWGEDYFEARHWHYDRLGRVIWVYVYTTLDQGAEPHIIYPFYTARGEVGKYRIHGGTPSEMNEEYEEIEVQVLERDSHGNWTKRKNISNIAWKTNIEEREIIYYKK